MSADHLGGLDVAFLCLEDVDHPMHMGGLAVFRPRRPIEPRRLVDLLAERASRIPRLAQRVHTSRSPLGPTSWVTDPGFDPREHVRSHHFPHTATRDELAAHVAVLMSRPLDRDRPLWQVHVFSGLADGEVALLVSLHHALADGATALLIGLGLFDGGAEPEPWAEESVDESRSRTGFEHLLDTTNTTVRRLVSGAGTAALIAGEVLQSTRVAASRSPLRCMPSPQRTFATATLPFARVRDVQRSRGGTVNDVLLAVIAAGLREWLLAAGHPVDTLRVRALAPVSRRHPSARTGATAGAGNRISGYLCDLSLDDPDPASRLTTIRAQMDRNKSRGPAKGAGAVAVLADLVPTPVHRLVTPFLAGAGPRLFDLVITNVPVPPIPLTLDGMHLREMFPIVPLTAGNALGIALLTYRDSVHIGLQAVPDAVPDLTKLADQLSRAIDVYTSCADTPRTETSGPVRVPATMHR